MSQVVNTTVLLGDVDENIHTVANQTTLESHMAAYLDPHTDALRPRRVHPLRSSHRKLSESPWFLFGSR